MSSSVATTDARFSCNICLEAVNEEPVVTSCGHLYCWPCLYEWLQPGLTPAEREALGSTSLNSVLFSSHNATTADSSRRVCPTCKAPCSLPRVVPIYVRTNMCEDNGEVTTGLRQRRSNIPRRPAVSATSTSIEERHVQIPASHHDAPSLSHGIFPVPTPIRDGEYLSRILLLLGSFVLLCLLMFP